MNRAEARSLKSRLVMQFRSQPEFVALAVEGLDASPLAAPWEGLAVGLAGSGDDTTLGLRATTEAVLETDRVSSMLDEHGDAISIEITGELVPQLPAVNTSRVRPLRAGWSIAHHAVTAGTLGAFATKEQHRALVLSNNHVLANTNEASIGDNILQQGPMDGGTAPADVVAQLAAFVPLASASNLVDAAIGEIVDGVDVELDSTGVVRPEGILDEDDLRTGLRVVKVGRTTGVTTGFVSLTETDDVPINYGGSLGTARFDNQIEIKGDDGPFSLGGDSGSLVLTEATPHRAVALLFAGGNGPDGPRTFANPIWHVLGSLGITLTVAP